MGFLSPITMVYMEFMGDISRVTGIIGGFHKWGMPKMVGLSGKSYYTLDDD